MKDILGKGAMRRKEFDAALAGVSQGIGHIAAIATAKIVECAALRTENAWLRCELSEARQRLVDAGMLVAESEMESDARRLPWP